MKNHILLQLSERLGLPYDEGAQCVYGAQDGYPFYIEPSSQNGIMDICFSVSRPEGLLSRDEIQSFTSVNPSIKLLYQNGCSMKFRAKGGVLAKKSVENIVATLMAATTMLRMKGFVTVCQGCGATGDIRMSCISGINAHLCDNCHTADMNNAERLIAGEAEKKENPLAGALGALLGSLIGAVAIFLVARLGYIAILPGIIMGVSTVFFYEKFSKKLSVKGIIICSVIMILMVYFANQCDWAYMIATELDAGFFEAYGAIMDVVNYSGLMDEYIRNLVLLYVFTLVGAVPMMLTELSSKKRNNVTYRLGEHRPTGNMPTNHL